MQTVNRIMQKLNKNSGESIGEVLVALLISALGLIMLASAINVSTSIVNNSRSSISEYYNISNNLEKGEGTSKSGTVSISGNNSGSTIYLTSDSDRYNVLFYVNSSAKTTVVSYR